MPAEYTENCRARQPLAPGQLRCMCVCSHVIDEPDQRHDEQTEPVELDDEPVRRLDLRHAILLRLLGLVQAEPQEEQRERRDNA